MTLRPSQDSRMVSDWTFLQVAHLHPQQPAKHSKTLRIPNKTSQDTASWVVPIDLEVVLLALQAGSSYPSHAAAPSRHPPQKQHPRWKFYYKPDIGLPKRKVIFQASFFRFELLNFDVVFVLRWLDKSTIFTSTTAVLHFGVFQLHHSLLHFLRFLESQFCNFTRRSKDATHRFGDACDALLCT